MKVGHLIQLFPMLTETFIRSYLQHAKHSHPFVLAETLFQDNEGHFPVTYLIEERDRKKMPQNKLRHFLSQLDYPTCYEQMIEAEHFDVLHAHFGQTGYRSIVLKRKVQCPLVTSFYGIDASLVLRNVGWQKRYGHLFDVGEAIICLGTQMMDRLCSVGCPSGKMHIVHLGVDVDEISFEKRFCPDKKDPICLLYCGRLVEKKGVFDALDAFGRVAHLWPQLIFRIVGTGELKQKLLRRVRALGLVDRVELVGALSHAQVIEEMQDAHLFILPSKTARNGNMEGTPTVLMEAQATGLPVLSTYHADIPEVVLDGQSGFLVSESDVSALADKLNLLLSQPNIWADFGKAGRAHIEKNYNIYTEVEKLETIYQKLM